ncbi:MAG TPA: VTT domain-containing protein [Anaerolineae bacterium]|nr:VTT domain-containing protein [Anaerolineae bacterium]
MSTDGTPRNDAPRTSRRQQILLLLLAIGLSLAIVWFTYHFQHELRHLGNYGYLGLFVISIIGNATLIIPAPVFVMACAAGMIYGPIGVGIVAGIGSAIGELTGYMAGAGGKALIPHGQVYEQLHQFMRRHGMLAIFLLAAIPNPIFDVGGIIAGALQMKAWKFLVAAAIGKSIRLGVTAWACQSGLPLLQQLFKQ